MWNLLNAPFSAFQNQTTKHASTSHRQKHRRTTMTSQSPPLTHLTHIYLPKNEATDLNTIDVWTSDTTSAAQEYSNIWLMWADLFPHSQIHARC